MEKKQSFFTSAGFVSLLSSIICIIIGLVVGFVVLLLLGGEKAYSDGFRQILLGGFYMMPSGIGKEIVTAAPLIMCGLSVAFAFKTGLFNIGASGQYTLGAFGGLIFAILLHAPWYVCLLMATLFGAVWGAIPGIFKAYLNVNEVITSIMFNWIGLYGCNTIMYGRGSGAMYNAKQAKTFPVTGGSLIPSKIFGWDLAESFGYKSCTIAIFLAIIVAVILYIILNKTTFGYELKACGSNRNAAKYAGINERRNIILSMLIAGALAGFGAGLFYLSGAAQWIPGDSTALPSEGFDGISVALLASSNPIGAIFSALFISHITTGGGLMNASLFPPEIADIISGIIIYLCAFSLLFRNMIRNLLTGRKKGKPAPAKAQLKPDAPAAGPAANDGKERE
ncbi:MAG: ABC transporter permease [Candidatus Ventricola sp.]